MRSDRTLTKYIYFYSYIFCVFAVSAGLYVGRLVSPAFYDAWYWPTQFATLGIGCAVVLEIVRQALAAYPGAERIARVASLAVFAATFCYVEWHVARRMEWSTSNATVELERDLRVIEALVLATVLAIVLYYRIELGKNVHRDDFGFRGLCGSEPDDAGPAVVRGIAVRYRVGTAAERFFLLLRRCGWSRYGLTARTRILLDAPLAAQDTTHWWTARGRVWIRCGRIWAG